MIGGAVGGAIGAAVAAKMMTRPRSVVWEDVRNDVVHSEHSRFVMVDGLRIHFQDFGPERGLPILLIHGYTASSFVWHNVAPMLAEHGFRAIAVDLVGFGYSEKPSWFAYTINAQADMVSRLLNHLGIGRAIVAGSSYGGAVASTLALDHSEQVEKLVLIDAVINDEALDHPILKVAAVRGVGEMVAPFVVDSRALLRHRMKGTLHPSSHHLITKERIATVRRPLVNADGHHSVLATSRNWNATRIERDAHLIDQPTLIIWGDNDNVIKIHNGHTLHREILNSRFVILKNTGHVPAEEKPDLVAGLIAEFVTDRKGRIAPAENGDILELVD